MRKHNVLFFVGLVGCLCAAACSSSKSSGGTGASSAGGSSGTSSGGSGFTCDIKSAAFEYCEEYDNLPSADESAVKQSCTGSMGTAGTSCPSANQLGSCAVTSGGLTFKEFYYSTNGFTAMEAQTACTGSGGKWTSG